MDSINQEQSRENSSLLANQQRQQQELIKLLTQHFHNQFYQLTCNNSNNQSRSPSTMLGPNHQFNSPINSLNMTMPPITSVDQTRVAPSPSSVVDTTLASRGLDLSCIDIRGNPLINEQQQQQQQALRSQQSNILTASTDQPSHGGFSTNPCSINSYQLSQFTLMNALGLTANDESHLALSLRQQSIIETIRQQQQHHHQQLQLQQHQQRQQHQLRDGTFGGDAHDQKQRNQGPRTFKSTNDIFTQDEAESGQALGAKSLLKFSINTILGRSSPQSSTTTDCETNFNSRDGPGRILSLSNNQIINKEESLVRESRDELRRVTDGDTGDSSSEADSPLQASTPVHQLDQSPSLPLNQPVASQIRESFPFVTPSSVTTPGVDVTSDSMPRNHQQIRHVPQAHLGGQHSLAPFLTNSGNFPWTVTSRGKPRRGMMRRAVFSDGQRVGLEKRFQMQKYISKPDRRKLAEKLGLRDSQVKIWFQNRRMKWRNSKERELLSAGGSREQTLPTRNNPNPDLSDVGETIRRLTSSS